MTLTWSGSDEPSCPTICMKKGSHTHSIAERRVPELIPVLGSQPAGDVSHKPGGRLHYFPPNPQLPSRPVGRYQFRCLVNRGTMGVNSLPKTVTRQRRGCDLNPGPSAPESSMLTTRLPSHSYMYVIQRSFWSKVIAGGHTQTHMADRSHNQDHYSLK